jgi:hypothetical protein
MNLSGFAGLFVGTIVAIILMALLSSYFVMLLWNNCLVSAVDGVRTISWLQAFGLSILFGMLFKGSVSNK